MIDALRTAGGVRVAILLLALVLALAPGLGLAQEEAAESGTLAWMAGLIPWRTMFGWVQIKGVAETLTLAILAAFLAVLAWLGVVWWQSARALKGLLGKIKAISRDPYGFAERFRDLSSEVQAKPFAGVRHAWEEFRESIFTERDEGGILAYNTIPPENFFTPDKLGMNFAAFRAMANYFVGVGLLLTFFGLAAALFFASESITAGGGDVAKTQEALQKLLNAATLKFMTSIAGLLSSIVLSVFVLFASRHVSGLCASICEELEARVRFAVQEHFAVLQLHELREQTAALKTFSTDLAVSIAEKIAAPVSAGVLDALNKSKLPNLTATMGKVSGDIEELMKKVDDVSGKLDSLAGQVAEKIEEPVKSGVVSGVKGLEGKIENLADKVVAGGKEGVEEITKGIPEKIAGAAETIERASNTLGGAANSLQNIASNLESQIRDAGKAFSDGMGEASGGVADKVSGISTQVGNLQKVMSELRGILDDQRAKFQGLADATQSAANALNLAADKHSQAARPVADAAARISDAADTIRNLGETVQGTHKSLEKLHQQINDSNNALRQFWEQHDERFVGVDDRLGEVVRRIIQGNEEYRGSVTNFVTELAGKLEGALGQLSAAISELGDVAEELRDPSAKGK